MGKQKKKMTRDEKARRDARLKEDMNMPMNKFLNETNKEGTLKYPMAQILRDYFLMNPDAVLNGVRMCNALLHEIRFHKNQAKKYYQSSLNDKDKVKMFDKFGKLMTKEDCYLKWINETQANYLVLSNLRTYLTQNLLAMVDNDLFTFEQYNGYLEKVIAKVKGLGYDLFPKKVTLIEPL